jgi:pilus assembly protein CpaF
VRGAEAFDMFQAMNTGHDGSLSTIHSNSPRDALMRLEAMVAMANLDIPVEFSRKYMSSAFNVLIHLSRLSDGTRKLVSLQEITGMEGSVITLQEIFAFDQTMVEKDGKVRGRFVFRGVRPRFIDKFASMGLEVSPELFNPDRAVVV